MPCFHPLKGYRSKNPNDEGRFPIVFDGPGGDVLRPITVPCGQCVGCRLERSRQWAVRCVHEASLHPENAYITLTYDNENLPKYGSLEVRAFQLFMKKMRKRHEPKKIRFFHCGEYGELLGRPHYHAIIFNHDFEDKRAWKIINENQLYISQELSELWPWGFSSSGAVSFQSAAYVARYIMKKMTGPKASIYLADPTTGEVLPEPRKPEYTTMSRRPGIGNGWLQKFGQDVKNGDLVVMNGHAMRPPRYYDEQFEVSDPRHMRHLKGQRVREARKHSADNTRERLLVKEQVKTAQIKLLPRDFE